MLSHPDSPQTKFLKANPGAVAVPGKPGIARFLTKDGHAAAIFGAVNHTDLQTGNLVDNDAALSTTANGWRIDGIANSLFIRNTGQGQYIISQIYTDPASKHASAFALTVPTLTYDSGFRFHFMQSGLTWNLTFGTAGSFELVATSPTKHGPTTYSFPLTSSEPLTVSPDGDLIGDAHVRLTRATMIPKSGKPVSCTPWIYSSKQGAAFTCDDSGFTEGQLPYRIDPISLTLTNGGTYNVDSYSRLSCCDDNDQYYVDVGSDDAHVTFNTSAIPSNASVSSTSCGFAIDDENMYSGLGESDYPFCSGFYSPTGTSTVTVSIWSSARDAGEENIVRYSDWATISNVTLTVYYSVPITLSMGANTPTNVNAGVQNVFIGSASDGGGDPEGVEMLITGNGTTSNACLIAEFGYLLYGPSFPGIYAGGLADDSGRYGAYNTPFGGSGGIASNSQCTVNATQLPPGSGALISYSVVAPISFSASFTGTKSIYLRQYNTATWQYMGSLTIVPPATQTITSSPNGRRVTVDGTVCTTPCVFNWFVGTNHTIDAGSSPQAGGTGTQYYFLNWSDGGAAARQVTATSSPATYNANYQTQYYLTTGVTGNGAITPASGWYNSGVSVSVNAVADHNSGYHFSGFSGALTGTATPQNVTMSAPQTVTASFAANATQTITTSPLGRTVFVDGTQCTAPCTYAWYPGDSHTIATSSPQAGATGTQYVFSSWSDAGGMSHGIVTPGSATTYIASFTTQYYLTSVAGTGGSISPSSGWFNSGTALTISALAFNGYLFNGFSGALSGMANPQNLTMSGPQSVTANFKGPGGGGPPGPPTGDSGNGLDPRRVGVRSFGSYWGAAGEQIDTTSGNVNFSVPLLKAQARGGWSIPLVLSYNSQNWRKDSAGTWLMGADVGYGFGWRLQIGSITPVWAGITQVDHYIFTDSTGAEYSLSLNGGGVWTSREGTYVAYDSNANKLYFPDGSFWTMGCTSSGQEPGSGVMYPTAIEDTNGNFITIVYAPGAGAGGALNTSARIASITDARGNGAFAQYPPNTLVGYAFFYNADPIPHLTQISTWLATTEQYTFSYTTNQALNSPIDGANSGTTTLLSGIAVTGMGVGHIFSYSAGGELSSVMTPLGGTLGWTYGTPTYEGSIMVREVRGRTMVPVNGGSTYSWTFGYNTSADAAQGFHASTTLADNGAGTQKVYTPAVTIAGVPLVMPVAYEEHNSDGSVPLHKDYAWAQDANGAAYMSSVTTTLDQGTPNATQTKTAQTLDTYGNIVQSQAFDYGNLSTAARTYSMMYLTDPNYTSRYIRNRLTQATVTTQSGGPLVVAQVAYDSSYSAPYNSPYYPCASLQDAGTVLQHDSNYGTNFVYRGNPVMTLNNGDFHCYAYQTTGVLHLTVDGAGTTVTSTTTAATNYSLPSVLTPNANNNLQTSIGYASSFAVTSVTGPNGATGTTTYDNFGRPRKTTIPDGAETDYSYQYVPNIQTATITTNGATQWKKTTLDGFGRAISVQTGYGSTTVNEVDTQYGPCACSPLGKLWRVSEPYAPGGSQLWTTYTYDGSGRTLTVAKPDGSLTSYSYQGNQTTVTDPAGKWKIFTSDAFGNLVTVIEPDPDPNNPTHKAITNYSYNALNQLTGVSMQRYTGPGTTYTQTRSFTWTGQDLTSATNPENGQVTYQYDAAHHVTQRTDAKGQQTRYSYDGYGRLSQVQHFINTQHEAPDHTYYYTIDDQPWQDVNYYYDSAPDDSGGFTGDTWGRLAEVVFHTGTYGSQLAYLYNYNAAGRVQGQRFVVNGPVLDTRYTWDNQGRMTGITYPGTDTTYFSGPEYQYTYDAMGRLSGMSQQTCSDDYYTGEYGCALQAVAGATYNVAGQIATLQYDTFSETRQYNSIEQLIRSTVTARGLPVMDMQYIYTAGRNNGRIVQSIDGVRNETVNYTYDSLNRLSTAIATNGAMTQQYSYDGFGNLTGTVGAAVWSFDPSRNAPAGTVDPNGNFTATGFGWDVENRLVTEVTSGYVPTNTIGYDPWGKRVWEQSYNPETGNGDPLVTVYSVAGHRLRQFTIGKDDQGKVTVSAAGESVYFGGKLIRSQGGTVATDRLGSVRSNGESYLPYGQERTTTGDNREKFATYWRDSTMGADYADQRYYAFQPTGNWPAGRFLSPDPGGVSTADAKNPASWNRYAYVGGDPVNFRDVSGGCRTSVSDEDETPDPCSLASDRGGGGPSPDGPPTPGPVPIERDIRPYYEQYPCDRNDSTNATILSFMDKFGADAKELADGSGTPWEWVLAVAAEETGYGAKGIAAAGTNNYFGLHVDDQSDTSHYIFQISTYKTLKDGWVATFASQTGFLDSGYNFMTIEKPWVSGAKDINAFASAIHQHGYGTTNANYVSELTGVASLIKTRENCPPKK